MSLKTVKMLAAALLCGMTVLSAYAQNDKKAMAFTIPTPTVSVGKVTSVNETSTHLYTARLESTWKVTIPARVQGKILKIMFKEGEFVKKGDQLYQLEDTTYVAALESAKAKVAQADFLIKESEAAVAKAKTALEHAKREFDRQKRLMAGNATTEQSYDLAEYTYDDAVSAMAVAVATKDAASASKAAADAALKDAENNYSYTKILAECDGKIGMSTYDVGNYVTTASGALAEIQCFDPIYVKFAISEPDYLTLFGSIENLKANGIVRITLANHKLYPKTAKITVVDNKIDETTGTLMLWALMDNKEMQLTPGGVVEAALSKQVAEATPAVPIPAIQIDGNGTYVWVFHEADKTIVKTSILVGETVGSRRTVKSGLKAGDMVVTGGAHKIIVIPGLPLKVNPVFDKD